MQKTETKTYQRMQKSSGNVFEDLGFPPEEAALLQLKTMLQIEIEKAIEKEKMTPKQVGRVLHSATTSK